MKNHKHVTLRLTREQARYLIVLAGQHSFRDDQEHGIVNPKDPEGGFFSLVPYDAYITALDQYVKRFGVRPVYNSLEDEEDDTCQYD